MKSIWQAEANKPSFSSLSEDIETDVLIIGGGMAGILTAYMLKAAGVDCVIAEARSICGGTTKNTTAKISCHHGAIFAKMIKRYGTERSKMYLRAHGDALGEYRRLAAEIDCNFREAPSYVYSLRDRAKLEKELTALDSIGARVKFAENTELPFSTVGAVLMKGQAEFHPLKFAYSLARGLNIFENTEVLEIKRGGAITSKGKIKAKMTVVTSHFPILNKHGFYFLKMYQHRSYVLALKNAQNLDGIYIDENENGLSFRGYGDILLLGGGGHRTGKAGGGWNELAGIAKKYYPSSSELCRYASQDCKTLDDIAYIGEYSPRTPNLLVATGFNKWGMSSSMVAAKILRDKVLGRKNQYSELFSPSRSIFYKQLFTNIRETALNFVKPTAPRCSHLGCALKYNKEEHSWDCACHGSRFAEDGEVIDNPAIKNIKTKN